MVRLALVGRSIQLDKLCNLHLQSTRWTHHNYRLDMGYLCSLQCLIHNSSQVGSYVDELYPLDNRNQLGT